MLLGILKILLGYHSPIRYPICIELHFDGVQYPKTPKLTPLNLARGIPLTIGVDMVDIRRSTNAKKKSMVKGVAGRSIIGVDLQRRPTSEQTRCGEAS